MAAFNPFQLLVPLATAALEASAGPTSDAAAREALVAAQTADRERALLNEQKLAEAAWAAQAAASEREVASEKAAAIAARRGELRRSLAAQRARMAASGIYGGRSSRALLEGLRSEADADVVATENEARTRIDAIRQGVEVKRRKNLLDLAEERRRGQLARYAARLKSVESRRGSLADALYGLGGALSRRF